MTDPDLTGIDSRLRRSAATWRSTHPLDHQLGFQPRLPNRAPRLRQGLVAAGVAALVAASVVVPFALSRESDNRLSPTDEPTATSETPNDGKQTETALSEPVVQEGQGDGVIELGPAPAGTTAISVDLTCLTPGKFYWEDGASLGCNAEDIEKAKARPNQPTSPGWKIDWVPGKTSTSIKAGPRQRWRAVATYVSVSVQPWGRNAKGQTYGTMNDEGMPDLLLQRADNGQLGYVYLRFSPMPPSPGAAPPPNPYMKDDHTYYVYKSDGETVIGELTVPPQG